MAGQGQILCGWQIYTFIGNRKREELREWEKMEGEEAKN